MIELSQLLLEQITTLLTDFEINLNAVNKKRNEKKYYEIDLDLIKKIQDVLNKIKNERINMLSRDYKLPHFSFDDVKKILSLLRQYYLGYCGCYCTENAKIATDVHRLGFLCNVISTLEESLWDAAINQFSHLGTMMLKKIEIIKEENFKNKGALRQIELLEGWARELKNKSRFKELYNGN